MNKLSFDLLGFVGLGGCFPFKDLLLYYVFFPLVNNIYFSERRFVLRQFLGSFKKKFLVCAHAVLSHQFFTL